MLEHTKRGAGVDRAGGRPRGLPDLTGVDLRTLRFMDDPDLADAVERVFWRTQELGDSWLESAGDGVHG
ncbi:hypothetical protein GCM10010222_02620 [Streptomyces tanashiensis]|uniref:hypothetical protein n=1 Tax=Streptomyces tanashiensis TaxID=67367 RepID=UPI00167B63C7|nr:hypothetical protein [Streptomyces tanashiensis]GGS65791.1 hypothetical protein GCM10010222_02620 [Streptomyces tanashiensis]